MQCILTFLSIASLLDAKNCEKKHNKIDSLENSSELPYLVLLNSTKMRQFMIKNYLIYSLVILTALSQTSCSVDPSLTLEIPEEGFKVVQHIPIDSVGRDRKSVV